MISGQKLVRTKYSDLAPPAESPFTASGMDFMAAVATAYTAAELEDFTLQDESPGSMQLSVSGGYFPQKGSAYPLDTSLNAADLIGADPELVGDKLYFEMYSWSALVHVVPDGFKGELSSWEPDDTWKLDLAIQDRDTGLTVIRGRIRKPEHKGMANKVIAGNEQVPDPVMLAKNFTSRGVAPLTGGFRDFIQFAVLSPVDSNDRAAVVQEEPVLAKLA